LSPRSAAHRPALELTFVCLFAAALYFTFLGHSPLAMSEGHRAIPAWEMLDSGDWRVPTLFGQPYLRKPPGTQWAMATASALLGRTEFAVRSVSALAIVVGSALSWWFARRWFGASEHGRGCALAAGLLFALTPLFWYPGRSAEIESLHNTCALASLLFSLDLLLAKHRCGAGRWWMAAGLALSLVCTALVKGPAAAPCLLGVLCAAVLVTRRLKTLASPKLWIAVLVATCAVAVVALTIRAHASSLSLRAVTQSPAGFLWDMRKWPAIVLLPISSLASALPASLLLPWVFRRFTAPSSLPAPPTTRPPTPPTTPLKPHDAPAAFPAQVAKALGVTVIVSLVIYAVLGVSNNRYAMPALTLVPIAASFARLGFNQARASNNPRWTRLGKLALLHRPIVPIVILTFSTVLHHAWLELRRDRISGRETGEAMVSALPSGATLIANQMIEYRPETFFYGRQAAEKNGRPITVRWIPPHIEPPAFPTYVALRKPRDPAVATAAFEAAAADDRERNTVFRGFVHRFEVDIVAPK